MIYIRDNWLWFWAFAVTAWLIANTISLRELERRNSDE